MATDSLIQWMEDHRYGEYDFDNDYSFKDNAKALRDREGGSKEGQANFTRFYESDKGNRILQENFGDLREEYDNQRAEINTASEAQLGQVKKRMGMSQETFDRLFHQRADALREARDRELEFEERKVQEAMFKAERQRRAQYARREIAAQKRRQAKSQERAVPRYSTPTFTVEREE